MKEYVIKRLGHQGDGVTDGPLFAPMTLPGEVVTGTPEGETLTQIRIKTPSEDRVKAPCRHFKSCGGCQLQHASDEFVAKWKAEVVERALAAHGLSTEIRPTITSPAYSRQRATVAAKRTKNGAMVGLYGRASGTIIEVPECHLMAPEIKAGFPVVQQLALIGTSRKAALAVTLTVSEDGLDVSVQNGKAADGPLRAQLAQICAQAAIARLSWNDETIAMHTPPQHRFGPARVVVPAGAFLQATPHGAATLQRQLWQIVAGSRRVVDLFAGCGTFSLPLAQHCEVHAVEGDAAMIAALDQGWRHAPGLKRITSEVRDLFRRPLLVDELKRFDAIIIDPPRAGAIAQVAELSKSFVPLIAYISCNPVTFARDAAQLIGAGYHLKWVQPVDQFRWSSHVELCAYFQMEL